MSIRPIPNAKSLRGEKGEIRMSVIPIYDNRKNVQKLSERRCGVERKCPCCKAGLCFKQPCSKLRSNAIFLRSKLQPHAAPFEVETLTTRSLFEIQTSIASGRVEVNATTTYNRFL